ncbi:hypothetical protein ILP97_18350 [Amycolatopsis sp. H6(2020)]|nr:hypothetical protein [Amycolatopsis sp. H6(2020)]
MLTAAGHSGCRAAHRPAIMPPKDMPTTAGLSGPSASMSASAMSHDQGSSARRSTASAWWVSVRWPASLRTRHDLEPVKLPEHLIVLPSLPLGPTGKVCRATLTQLAATPSAMPEH